ncbi:ABC transporter permease [Fannyhessea vaginae]|uniref:ABC transporter permease n=1 Tax=Fannyhessea vaginae TaxID=82135 RepID=UPI00076FA9E5|nr:FtsX-like permease family protein [Fannyhessea vaginae]KXG88483.1 efflux ABC transporter, permease protein [Fannyhessea vaginae]
MLLYIKLAWGNFRRALKDFAVYFVTLMLSVSLFYSFNTLTNQAFFVELSSSTSRLVLRMAVLITGLSIFLMIVIGILIVYANVFFMRRRVREFATYLLLGMKKSSLAFVILIENYIVGICALIVGLLVGVVVSQFSSLAVLKLFNSPVERFHFLLVPQAVIFTACMFGVVFVLSTLCATFVISRTRLSVLFRSSFASDRFKIKNPWITLVLFVVSVLLIAQAYRMFSYEVLTANDGGTFLYCTALVVLGTALFFYSVSTAFTQIARAIKPLYYRGLNLYVVRQFASRINSSWISMTMICATIFIALCTLSIGFTAVASIRTQESLMAPTDFFADFICKDGYEPEQTDKLVSLMAQEIPSWNTTVRGTARLTSYTLGEADNVYTIANLISDCGLSKEQAIDGVPIDVAVNPVYFVGCSEYNRFRALAGLQPIELADNEVRFASYPGLADQTDSLASSGKTITLADKYHNVRIKPKLKLSDLAGLSSNPCSLIVPDSWVHTMKPRQTRLFAQFYASSKEVNEQFSQELADSNKHAQGILGQNNAYHLHVMNTALRYEMLEAALAIRVMGTFVAVYTGIILLITSAAILSIQQLSELSYMRESYTKLLQLGATRASCSGTIFTQLGIWFMLPCSLAISHAFCVMKEMDALYTIMGADTEAKQWLFITAGIVLAIYALYLLMTFVVMRVSVLGKQTR